MLVSGPMLVMLVILSGLGVGGLAVLYGTVAKNKWGINIGPVQCPRCGAPAPSPPEPRSLREARWGYWTCPVCAAQVDKWGREVAAGGPRGDAKRVRLTRPSLRKKFTVILAGGYFCLTLLLDWIGVGIAHRGFPSTLGEASFQVLAAAAETALFTALYYLAAKYLLERFFPRGDRGSRPGAR